MAYNVISEPLRAPTDFDFESDFNLHRVLNIRFGFSFLAPDAWVPWYPQNGDGAKFAHPEDENVEVRAWGGCEVLEHDFNTSVDWYMDFLRGRGYFELISRREATRSVTEIPETSDNGLLQQQAVRAVELAYRSGPNTLLHVMTRVNGTNFDLHCQAPSNKYSEFRPLFLTIVQSLRVLGPSMVPHAQNVPALEDQKR